MSKNWADLPTELQQKILEKSDFLSKHRFAICSKSSLNLVKSLKNRYFFVKIQFSSEFSENSRKFTVFDGNRRYFLEISEKLQVFPEKTEISTVLVENSGNSVNFEEIPEKSIISKANRLILRGNFENFPQKSINRNWNIDLTRKWSEWANCHGVRVFEVNRWRTRNSVNEHFKAHVELNLISFVAKIYTHEPKQKIWWCPEFDLRGKNPQEFLDVFEGKYEDFGDFQIKKIPISPKKEIFVKYSKCGVFVSIGNPKTLGLPENKCGLELVCSGNCYEPEENRVETEYFRNVLLNLFEND